MTVPTSPLRSLTFALLLALAAAPAPAQDAPRPIPIDPELVVADARAAYTAAPTADEIAITVRGRGNDAESERVVVRIEPGALGDAGPRSMLLELGSLRIHARPGRLVAAARDSSAFWSAEIEGGGPITPSLLRSLIPAVPLPQIALACPNSAPDDLAPPFTDSLFWVEGLAAEATARAPATAAASGRSTLGLIILTIDVETNRLRKFRFNIREGAAIPASSAVTQVDMEIAPIDPGDPASWVIREDGLTRVDSLADLLKRPAVAAVAPLLAPGDPVPDILLTNGDSTSWTLHTAARSAGGLGDAGPIPGPVVLLLFRSTLDPAADAATEADALAGREAIRLAKLPGPSAPPHVPEEAPSPAPGGGGAGEAGGGGTGSSRSDSFAPSHFTDKAAAITNLAAFSPDRFADLRTRWLRAPKGTDGHPAPAVLLDADQLFWSSSWPQTMARFSRDAKALLAVVGEDLTLRAVIVLDGRAGQSAGIADDLSKALNQRPPVR